jgi:hypothetical protein
MARENVTHDRRVQAIGDSGHFESVRESEAVSISTVPVGDDNAIVPATLRFLRKSASQGRPTNLLRILQPNTRLNRRPYARVYFKCTPFERYRLAGKPVLGHEDSCFVRNEADAYDPLFASLSFDEGARILSAVQNSD